MGDTPGSSPLVLTLPSAFVAHANQEVGTGGDRLVLGSAYDATPAAGPATAASNRTLPWGALAVYVTC